MFSCKNCVYTSNWYSILSKHEKSMHENQIDQPFGYQNSSKRVQNGMSSCENCTFTSN